MESLKLKALSTLVEFVELTFVAVGATLVAVPALELVTLGGGGTSL